MNDEIGPVGMWTCDRCGYGLTAKVMDFGSGNIGMDPRTREVCPNEGADMRRITWREYAEGMEKGTARLIEVINEKEAEIERLRSAPLAQQGAGSTGGAPTREVANVMSIQPMTESFARGLAQLLRVAENMARTFANRERHNPDEYSQWLMQEQKFRSAATSLEIRAASRVPSESPAA